MSFRCNDYQQTNLEDRYLRLTEREKHILDKSWAPAFYENVFLKIDERMFAKLYPSETGRPNTPINVVVGSLILKEIYGLTDEELVETILFDLRFQYALGLTGCNEIPYSDRTPSRFREKLLLHEMETGEELLKKCVEKLGQEFVKLMKIDDKIKRMDSLMISSNCKSLTRLELIYTCVQNMVKAVNQTGETALLPSNLIKYLDKDNKNYICYRLKDTEINSRLKTSLKDALDIMTICEDGYTDLKEYKLLARLLKEHTTTKNGETNLKEHKDVSTDSLQNPSDPDATYSRKYGKVYRGYSGNVVESYSENGSIITDYDLKPNIYPDKSFCSDEIKKLSNSEEEKILIADGAYGYEDNYEEAKNANVKLITTNLIGRKPDEEISKFVLNFETQTVEQCPMGYTPIKSVFHKKAKGSYIRTQFAKEQCEHCPNRDKCKSKILKNTAIVRLGEATVERAKRVKNMGTDEYKKYANIRNGIESIPSLLRRKYLVDHIPTGGLPYTKLRFGFKIAAINALRVIAKALASCFDLLISLFSILINIKINLNLLKIQNYSLLIS